MNIIETKDLLTKRINESVTPREVLKAKELKQLYAQIPNVDVNERREFGRQVNLLKEELEAAVSDRENEIETINKKRKEAKSFGTARTSRTNDFVSFPFAFLTTIVSIRG